MMWGGGHWFMGGIMLVFWGLVIAAVVLLVRRLGTGQTPARRDAMEVLRERFAAGEIDEEEFERRKKALER
ncbi:SHOCT domain-containing protein [Citreimonas salinaria]|uniref:Putative membrane protein n=1 Tax=Citreimonas salinaria TaxID=321339 RepID=A0A1H3MYN6_9RHOB|nr:SHOCT domain-containing protein [Citreimonas salinaria]SDY81614.1 putative membrane protein [Citreimonas salinaria]